MTTTDSLANGAATTARVRFSLFERVTLLLLGTYAVLFAGALLTGTVSAAVRALAANLTPLIMAPLVLILAFRASRSPSVDPRSQRAWRWFALALFAQWFGESAWFYYETIRGVSPSASIADVGYLLWYPLLFMGLRRLPFAPRSDADHRTFWLDVAIVICAGTIAIWFFEMSTATRPDGGIVAWVVTVGYPLGDIALQGALVTLLMRQTRWRISPTIHFMGFAMTTNLVADVAYAYQVQHETYRTGEWLDLAWGAMYLALAAAAIAQRRESRAADDLAEESSIRRRITFDLLPVASVAAVFVLLLVVSARHGHQQIFGLVVGASTLIALVIARQLIAMRENLRLTREVAARAGEARFRALVQNSSDVISVLSPDTTVQFVSSSVERFAGAPPDYFVGKRFADYVHPDDVPALMRFFEEVVRSGGIAKNGEWRVCRPDGTWAFIDNVATNLLAEPTVGGIVLNSRDVSERRQLEEQLSHQAFHDSLTNLANRQLFLDRVDHAFHRAIRQRSHLAVLFLDLDNFKSVNDTLGHVAGDALLGLVAARLSACVRTSDTLARLGGDEFGILLEDMDDVSQALVVAERVADAMRGPFDLDGREVFVGASIGLATGASGDTVKEVLRNADVAMYVAKARGKAQHVLFEPAMHAAYIERMALEADLRRAIERKEFELHYQPIVRLADGRVTSAEALLRWHHPDRGLVRPLAFIPIAEESGLICDIGRWALESACRQARAWQLELDMPIRVTVNISPRHLRERQVIDDVRNALDASGLDPSLLVIEITESVVADTAGEVVATLEAIRGLGVALALDDFGTGYSSLGYLQRLPIDVLKIDKSFVDRLVGEDRDDVLVQTIIGLAKTLRLRTVAEGVEESEQSDLLRLLGCEMGQGYLYARPAPVPDITRLLIDGAGTIALPEPSRVAA